MLVLVVTLFFEGIPRYGKAAAVVVVAGADRAVVVVFGREMSALGGESNGGGSY